MIKNHGVGATGWEAFWVYFLVSDKIVQNTAFNHERCISYKYAYALPAGRRHLLVSPNTTKSQKTVFSHMSWVYGPPNSGAPLISPGHFCQGSLFICAELPFISEASLLCPWPVFGLVLGTVSLSLALALSLALLEALLAFLLLRL